jgi:hypothetical protein
MDSGISKGWRPSHPDLTVGLQALYHHIPLGLLLEEVTEELFLIRMVLADPLQATLYPTLHVVWIKCQPEVEDFSVVTMVVTDSCPARETLFPSPPDDPLPTMVSEWFPPQPPPR